jgi:cell division protein FtsI (penicillin-binding protein 3)
MDSSEKKFIYYLLIVATFLFAVYVIVRFALIMLPVQAEGYRQPLESTDVRRGTIYDRTGTILAAEAPYYSCAVLLKETDNLSALIMDLSILLDESYDELMAMTEGKSQYALIKRRLSDAQRNILSEQISNGELEAVVIEKRYGRLYPQQYHAASLIGFTNIDNEGLSGVEYQFDRLLSPLPDPNHKQTAGGDIYLTIDHRIQFSADAHLESMVEKHQPDSAVMVVADAKTGEILSYSSYPWFDLNNYNLSTADQRRNRIVSEMYEPGSVFKVFSLSSVLEAGEADTDQLFLCDGSYTFTMPNGRSATINCLTPHGEVGPEEMLKYSCNGAISYYALGTSDQAFYQGLSDLGFGNATGIELPAESSGVLRSPELWSGRSKPTISFGQEIAVTPIQIIQAATALTNDGQMLQPRIIAAFGDPETGELSPTSIIIKKESLSSEVANAVLEMTQSGTESGGTATRVHRDAVETGAKTGTSQVLDLETNRYSTDHVIASTVAFFPIEDPEYIVYVAADNPKGPSRYGSTVAAPVVKELTDDLVSMGLLRTGKSRILSISGESDLIEQ